MNFEENKIAGARLYLPKNLCKKFKNSGYIGDFSNLSRLAEFWFLLSEEQREKIAESDERLSFQLRWFTKMGQACYRQIIEYFKLKKYKKGSLPSHVTVLSPETLSLKNFTFEFDGNKYSLVDFSGKYLRSKTIHTDLRGIYLEYIMFHGKDGQSILSCANLASAILYRCQFQQLTFERVILSNSQIIQSDFRSIEFKSSNFSNSILISCFFNNTELEDGAAVFELYQAKFWDLLRPARSLANSNEINPPKFTRFSLVRVQYNRDSLAETKLNNYIQWYQEALILKKSKPITFFRKYLFDFLGVSTIRPLMWFVLSPLILCFIPYFFRASFCDLRSYFDSLYLTVSLITTTGFATDTANDFLSKIITMIFSFGGLYYATLIIKRTTEKLKTKFPDKPSKRDNELNVALFSYPPE